MFGKLVVVYRLVHWTGRVICKIHKNKNGIPSELSVVDNWRERDIV